MATLETRLQDNGYNNWVKGGLSLDVARDGIVNFVDINNDNYHQDVMNSLSGASCGNCSIENVIPCRNNNNFCKFQNRICNVHDSNDPNKRSQNCPNLICDKIQIAIVKEHRYNGPSWRNTDSQRWCREPWQLAKCFMSQGYKSSTSAADTDLPGLLSVVINNKRFNNVVTDNLSAKNNTFCQAREVRNKILHSPNMQLTDQELQDCILVLDNMLSDSQSLAAYPDAGQARTMLAKILNDQINITTEDERQVRALREMELTKTGALAEIQTEKNNAIDAVKKELTDTKDAIQTEKIDAIDAVKKEQIDTKYVIKAVKKDAIDAVKNELTDTKDAIQAEKKDAIGAVKKELTDTKDTIQTEKNDAIDAVKKELTDTKYAIQTEKIDAIDAVKKEVTDTKDTIQTEKNDAIDAVKTELTDTKCDIQTEKNNAINAVKKELTDTKDDIQAEKKDAIDAVKKQLTVTKNVIQIEKIAAIHAVKKEVTDTKDTIQTEKNDAIDAVKKELTDTKCDIQTEKNNVIDAVKKELTNTKDAIQTEKIDVIDAVKKEQIDTKYVIKAVKKDAIDAVKNELTDTKDAIQTEKKDAIGAVKKELTDTKDTIQTEKNDAIDAVKKELTDTKYVIQTEKIDAIHAVKKKVTDIKDTIQTEKNDAIDAVKKELTDTKCDIQTEKNNAIDAVKKELTDTKDDIQTEKKDAIDAVKKQLTVTKDVIQIEKKDAIHAVKKEMTDTKDTIQTEKNDAIDTVKKELTDTKCDIQMEKNNAIDAVKKEFTDTKDDIQTEKKDAIDAVKKELTDTQDVIQIEKIDAIDAVKKELTDTKNDIRVETKDAIDVVKTELTEAKDDIEAEKEKVIADISEKKDEIKEEKEVAIAGVRKELTEAKEVIKVAKEEAIAALQTVSEENYSKIKQDMKAQLISRYQQDEQLSAPLFPLVLNDYQKDIDELYVKPYMKLKYENGINATVKSYKDIFKDKRKKIYVVGYAGLGKTSLCQKMVSTWCREHSETEIRSDYEQPKAQQKQSLSETEKYMSENEQLIVQQEPNLSVDDKLTDESNIAEQSTLSDEDTCSSSDDDDDGWSLYSDDSRSSDNQQTMVQFEFLFYISLREADKENDVEDMITYQILSEDFHEHLPTVLKKEKVLIILDGLDEWYGDSTAKKRQRRLVNKGIPAIRTMMKNGTILTTTRPWKLEAIQLKSTQIDAKIELLGIERVSSRKLIQIMLYHLNKGNSSQKKIEDFISELEDKQLEHFMAIPVILKQLICLWHSGKKLGQNKSVIYCQMVELLFELGQARLYQDPKLQYENKKEKWMKSPILMPACFDTNDQCRHHRPLLTGLSEVAFKTLLCENQESCLVFKRSEAEIHGMSAEDINICLKIGILSQSGVIKNSMSHIHISFLHKTYQEFFAALFVTVDQTESDQCVQTIQDICNSQGKCLEMQTMITFISGMSSEITCKLMAHIKPLCESRFTLQHYLCDCLREGWCCNHGNKHLKCDIIEINTNYQPEHLELLYQVNIHQTKRLEIDSRPTARCLEYLLQVDTLEVLGIWPSFSRSSFRIISEDNVYSLIHHNTHTLTTLYIWNMTLSSRTKLSTLLYNIQHLSSLSICHTTMSQQLLDSLQEFKAQRSNISWDIQFPKILPDIMCTA